MSGDRVASPDSDLPFPLETVRHWYVTPFGGLSEDLELGQVGIHADALVRNTELVPHQDRVTISVVGEGGRRPLFMQEAYEVVPLDGRRPDAFEKSPQGEAVLAPDRSWQVIRRPFSEPRTGQQLLLNSTTSRVFGADPEEVLARLLRRQREERDPDRPVDP